MSDDGAESDTLTQIYERLEALDLDVATVEASKLLFGLGFTSEMQRKKAREFSGGWRMRIALAKALFVKPTMLLLDEPTNHLDLEACVWLEEYLKTYPTILVLVSHSQGTRALTHHHTHAHSCVRRMAQLTHVCVSS